MVEATFSYPMVCWLVHAIRGLSIQWEDYERETQRAVIWPRFFPLMEEDSLTEANVRIWTGSRPRAAGRMSCLGWSASFSGCGKAEKEKAALYDSLEIMVRWDMSGSRASRTLARKPVRQFFFHRELDPAPPGVLRRRICQAAFANQSIFVPGFRKDA